MFVLAHLSDPHLAPLAQPRWSELMGKRVTGFAHWRTSRRLVHRSEVLARVVADLKAKNPDHIAVTGDLVNISAGAEYAPARAWLESLGGPREVTLVPGNHDVYVRAAANEPHSHWGDYMRGDDARAVTFPFLRRRGPLALIGLSSAVPTPPFVATGRLGEEQIARLIELLDRCRRERLFRIVLVHHAPGKHSPSPSKKTYRRGEVPRRARTMRRRTGDLRPRSRAFAVISRRTAGKDSGARGPFRLAGSASRACCGIQPLPYRASGRVPGNAKRWRAGSRATGRA